jgi:hypothetical protein
MMSSIKKSACLGVLALGLWACNHSKPKPVSHDISKTTVLVEGKKDSVINNPQRKYGSATVADPCVKSLLKAIQASKSFREITLEVSPQNISYVVNWVKASAPFADTSSIANGLRVDVRRSEEGKESKLCSYLYNNTSGTLYLLDSSNKYKRETSNIVPDILKSIRNSCYWGVASGKAIQKKR